MDQWRNLGANPELARSAVEEVMRVNPTITWVSREASVDVEYKDLVIPQGKTIHLLNHSIRKRSTTDLRQVEFDITAQRPPHFGFGGGMHHCLGHYVARLDMAEAYKALAQRLPDFEILVRSLRTFQIAEILVRLNYRSSSRLQLVGPNA
jgi:cytochrome P450